MAMKAFAAAPSRCVDFIFFRIELLLLRLRVPEIGM